MAHSAKDSVKHLLRAVSAASCRCPAHSRSVEPHHHGAQCSSASPSADQKDYAFEMACSNIRYGAGVTREVGMDFKNLGSKRVCVMTDPTIAKLPAMKTSVDALTNAGVSFDVFDQVRVEPTDSSFEKAIAFAKSQDFDAYLAVGGGSVMDTCKAANLFASKPDAQLLDYVNAPIGKGLPVTHELKPLIAVPTTAGTGSETTGTAVFDYEPMKAKTGISNRAIRPLLGIVDPLHTLTMPNRVTAYSGFDVLCHALESFTALPYTDRSPRPSDPKLRPAYQGSNPISDVWSKHALHIMNKYFRRSVNNADDFEARSNMHLASVFAGIGFGNAGVHLCHGMSYPISGNVKTYVSAGYDQNQPLVPHGLSVVLTAPAVFQFTYSMCPERHLEAAQLLGADISGVKREDSGKVLSDTILEYMRDLDVDNGLAAIGYSSSDISGLVQGTLPQERVTKLSPRQHAAEDLAKIFEDSLTIY